MANLVDTIQNITTNVLKNAGLTDFVSGTVSKVSPLEITLVSNMLPIPATALILTSAVIEKKLSISGIAPSEITCYENGVPLGAGIITRGLSVGDKVVMLRVMDGQQFIVLSRTY